MRVGIAMSVGLHGYREDQRPNIVASLSGFGASAICPARLSISRICQSGEPATGRSVNAPLRVVDAEGLRSAPITFFDQQLLSFAKPWWQKPARIIGETMAELLGPPMEPYYQAGDGLLAARVIALIEAGVLEGRGDLMNIQQSDVRLPNQASRSGEGTL